MLYSSVYARVPVSEGVFDEGLNGLLLGIGEQSDHDLPPALHHPKDGWSFFLHGTTATFTLESASTAFSPLDLDYLRLPFMASNYIGFVTLDFV